jgi:hypothetical protein
MRRLEVKLHYIAKGTCPECNYYRPLFVRQDSPSRKVLSQDEMCMQCFFADFESRGLEPMVSTDIDFQDNSAYYP